MGDTLQLTEQNFDAEVIENESPVLVDFWAEWCGPCHAVAPVVEEIAADYKENLKVGKVDVDANPGLAMRYGIRSIPSLLIFKGGKVADQIVGAVPKNFITGKIDALL